MNQTTAPAGAPLQTPSELPELMGKRYRIERLLGVGGMGAVYRARDLVREQFGDPEPWVALKTLNDTFSRHPDANALLYSEFALTSRLHHRHIVRPHSFHVDAHSQRAFLTLELLAGPTLDQIMAAQPQGLPWDDLQPLALALLDALQHAHQRGVLHGDIKPTNVMLCDNDVRLFDFGLGQGNEGLLSRLPRLSRRRLAAWTPRYAALELLDGGDLSPATDLYALACVLYELASGHHPFSRLTARQAMRMDQYSSLQKPANLPAHCWPALRRALAFEPALRTSSVSELREVFGQPLPRWWPWPRWAAGCLPLRRTSQ